MHYCDTRRTFSSGCDVLILKFVWSTVLRNLQLSCCLLVTVLIECNEFICGIVSMKSERSANILKFLVHNRNVTLAFKCLQLHDRYSNSQCVRSNV